MKPRFTLRRLFVGTAILVFCAWNPMGVIVSSLVFYVVAMCIYFAHLLNWVCLLPDQGVWDGDDPIFDEEAARVRALWSGLGAVVWFLLTTGGW